jgi:hypothetical protein
MGKMLCSGGKEQANVEIEKCILSCGSRLLQGCAPEGIVVNQGIELCFGSFNLLKWACVF